MPRLLELFSGTGSVGRVFAEAGWEVVSVDLDPKCGATHCEDILTWDFMQYPSRHFDFVHASPPCTEYSVAKTVGVRDLDHADAMVCRTILILARFMPKHWVIENPYTGLMKSRPCMEGMEQYLKRVTYCSYGMPYKKETAIWTNMAWEPRTLCSRMNPCEKVQDGRHPVHAQHDAGGGKKYSTTELHRIPQELVLEWLAVAQPNASEASTEFGSCDAASASSVELEP